MKQIRWVGAALLGFSFASAGILPAWAGFENGPIEIGQVFLLMGGAIIALLFAIHNQTRLRCFWLAVSLIWTVLALRELSWGGVFMPPSLMSEQGPYFSSTQLWYKPYIFSALFAVALVVGAFFIKGKAFYVLKFLLITRRFPFADIVLFVAAMIVSAGAEGHMGLSFGNWGHMHVLEEMSEMAAYVFLLSAQARVMLALRR